MVKYKRCENEVFVLRIDENEKNSYKLLQNQNHIFEKRKYNECFKKLETYFDVFTCIFSRKGKNKNYIPKGKCTKRNCRVTIRQEKIKIREKKYEGTDNFFISDHQHSHDFFPAKKQEVVNIIRTPPSVPLNMVVPSPPGRYNNISNQLFKSQIDYEGNTTPTKKKKSSTNSEQTILGKRDRYLSILPQINNNNNIVNNSIKFVYPNSGPTEGNQLVHVFFDFQFNSNKEEGRRYNRRLPWINSVSFDRKHAEMEKVESLLQNNFLNKFFKVKYPDQDCMYCIRVVTPDHKADTVDVILSTEQGPLTGGDMYLYADKTKKGDEDMLYMNDVDDDLDLDDILDFKPNDMDENPLFNEDIELSIIEEEIEDGTGGNALFYAIGTNDIKSVRKLVKTFDLSKKDVFGSTPYDIAVKLNRSLEMKELLLHPITPAAVLRDFKWVCSICDNTSKNKDDDEEGKVIVRNKNVVHNCPKGTGYGLSKEKEIDMKFSELKLIHHSNKGNRRCKIPNKEEVLCFQNIKCKGCNEIVEGENILISKNNSFKIV